MRKYIVLIGLLAALAIPATALAVSLHQPHVGSSCPDGGTFHFVANGVDGGIGTLTANFSGGGSVSGLAPDHTNQGTNHWTIDGIGTLTGASATVGAKLVLSDFTCDEKKKK